MQPFYPSPLRDDGYDIAHYEGVHKSYGTLKDFRTFLDAAHARDLRVITELVINHTSDQHPWFQAARRAKRGTSKRNFYVWSDSDQKYAGVRIIFSDTERSNWAWDPVAESVLLAPLLLASAGSQFRQPVGAESRRAGDALLAGPGRRRDAVGRRAVPDRARGDVVREPARDP